MTETQNIKIMLSQSNKLRATTRRVPCGVCEDTTGDCRHNDSEDFFLCNTYADARIGEQLNGYICTKDSKSNGGLWSSWSLHRGDFKGFATNYRGTPKRKQEPQKPPFTEQQRHEEYLKVFNQSPLNQKTLADITRRGFNADDIAAMGIKSVDRKAVFDVVKGLPGFCDGIIYPCFDGYMIPIKNYEGMIQGFQIRRYDTKDGNKYLWGSGGTDSNSDFLKIQPYKENPLAVYKPHGQPVAISLAEGVGFKPYSLAKNHQMIGIGAAGNQFTSSYKLLRSIIEKAYRDYGKLPVIIYPDAGWTINSNIVNSIVAIAEMLITDGYTVQVADWNQCSKLQSDIDELDPQEYKNIRILSWHEFKTKWSGVFADSRQFENWARKRVRFSAQVEKQEKYLKLSYSAIKDYLNVLVRKALGGGKTEGTFELILEILKLFPHYKVIWISHRNTLNHNTVKRAKIRGIKAKMIKDCFEKLDKSSTVDFRADSSIQMWVGCPDSYEKFKGLLNHYHDYIVVVDEYKSVQEHLCTGGTLKGRQRYAVEWFTELLISSQKNIFLDANMTDNEVNFVKQLTNAKTIAIHSQQLEIEPRTFYILDNPDGKGAKKLPAHLIEIAQKSGKFLWISDSQKSCEVADLLASEWGYNILRVDSKTTPEEITKTFMSNPKLFVIGGIDEEGIEHKGEFNNAIAISPSAESGLSIDLYDYFDAVLFDIKGVLDIDKLLQLSARLRDKKVPIYVSCPEFSNFGASVTPYLVRMMNDVINQRLELLLSIIFNIDESLMLEDALVEIFNATNEKASNDIFFKESFTYALNKVYELKNLRECLITALCQDGNIVISQTREFEDSTTPEIAKKTKEQVLINEANAIFNAKVISFEDAERLAKDKNHSYPVQCSIALAYFKHNLPGIENTDSWCPELILHTLVKDKRSINGLWRLHRLLDDELDKACFKLEKQNIFTFGVEPASLMKDDSVKIHAMRLLGVDKAIINRDFCVQSSNDLARQVATKYHSGDEWYRLIGIQKANYDEKRPDYHLTQNIKKLADYFGLELEQTKKVKGVRTYKTRAKKALLPYIVDIKNCLKRRADRAKLEAETIDLKLNLEITKIEKGQIEELAKF